MAFTNKEELVLHAMKDEIASVRRDLAASRAECKRLRGMVDRAVNHLVTKHCAVPVKYFSTRKWHWDLSPRFDSSASGMADTLEQAIAAQRSAVLAMISTEGVADGKEATA